MDVATWLRSLGLERYEEAFRDNEIDERVLLSLTQEDLKEIGVGPVGHRRMLLEAIAALRGDTGGNPPGADVSTAPSVPNVAPEDRAERRQVTVMFSDLVGSTRLYRRAWTLKIFEKLSRPIRTASQRPWFASGGLSLSTWATGC